MKRHTVCLVSSSLVMLCTVQALYWPLLPKPGTVIEWWQVGVLAKIGFLVGAPALIVIAKSPLSGLPQTLLAWSLSFIWAGIVCLVLRVIVNAITPG